MTSRERMLTALSGESPDHIPCCFMLFFNLYEQCSGEVQFIQKQMDMGLDPFAHVGFLDHSLHPEASMKVWVDEEDGQKVFNRRIDTPAGPLTSKVVQRNGWPTEDDFPIMKDWIITRSEEFLVKPEQDLEKLRYLFGPASTKDIQYLKETADQVKTIANKHDLLQIGGWKAHYAPHDQRDYGVVGCDAMSWLSGYVDIMQLSLTDPEIVAEYARIIHEWSLHQIEIYLDITDADLIIRRAWYETTEFWTPEAYKRIIFPTLKKEAEVVHQAGKKYGYIITSAFEPLVDYILDADIDVLIGLDPEQGKGTELNEIRAKFSDAGKALWGGVSGALTVELGTEEETENAVKTAIDTLGGNGGFILSPVDNVREDTENAWRNTSAFIDAWKKYR